MFNALSHVVPSHMMDRTLYPFESLKATGVADPEGDTAFDQESFSGPDENDTAADTGAELPAEQHIAVHQIQRAKASS